jgi:isopentenyl diphosphate isomerase/L-lactate dehydrogenase-like FMN-dependent dehydrogenase
MDGRGPWFSKASFTRKMREAHKLGADGLVVSNHGGRQLDAAPAPLDALPAIVEAVGSPWIVMVDAGVRRGSDIVRGVLAGDQMVFAGRPTQLADRWASRHEFRSWEAALPTIALPDMP